MLDSRQEQVPRQCGEDPMISLYPGCTAGGFRSVYAYQE